MAKAKKQPASEFEKAVDFLALLYNAKDDQTIYCRIVDGEATAYNMIVGIGTPIHIDFQCCPNVDLLREAIKRCKDNFVIAQYSPDKLIVRQDEFHAFIPCLRSDAALTITQPDAPVATMGEAFIEALDKVSAFADDKAPRLLEAAIQLYDGSVLATCGSVVIEAWHGINMPNGLLLPKVAAKVLHKIKKEIVSFGISPTSITFHFADGSWMKSQLYKDKLPDIRQHINGASMNGLEPIPHKFFEAVAEVYPFSVDGFIWVEGNRVASHPFSVVDQGSGLSLPFDDSMFGMEFRRYKGDDLHMIRKIAKQWNVNGRDDGTLFVGEQVRGMIWHSKQKETTLGATPNDDEDIPF